MIKGKGTFRKVAGTLQDEELKKALSKLPDNQSFEFVIVDQKDNRLLPYQIYLFNVVLKSISEQLDDHPSTEALYRYFEEKFAPPHICTIHGEKFTYFNLKGERKDDVVNFVERISEYVQKHWNIEFPDIQELKDVKVRDSYATAYLKQDIDWSNFISSRKNNKSLFQDERNIKKV